MAQQKCHTAECKSRIALDSIRADPTTAVPSKPYAVHSTRIDGSKWQAIANMAARRGEV